ncbi:MAG: phosphoenolpyruvate carboxylase, partial [Flavobacteriales bacterium]|nr:phosphoenolpyruvate carboxylase [Flavobacteriales bacterium]
TQFYPKSVLDIIADLRALVRTNDLTGIDHKLHQLGLTSLLNTDKPTPVDEAKNIIYYLRTIYYDAIGNFYSDLRSTVDTASFDNPRIIRLGFWPGGDRDGNPFVTSEVTLQVADELRMTLMKCYYKELKALSKKLTFRGVEQVVHGLLEKLYASMFDPEQVLSQVQIETPLEQVQQTLMSEYHGLYQDDLQRLMDKVRLFGTHFAAMDIRQDHSVHVDTITAILMHSQHITESLDELDAEKLKDILLHEHIDLTYFQVEDARVMDTIASIRALHQIQSRNGATGCERYIISNSEDIFSVLFVFALLRWSGLWEGDIPVDIVPLFETMKGMEESDAIMKTLFDDPTYRSHVESRDSKQTMMLGFSDGTKDGGYLRANWEIFKTKEKLSMLCEEESMRAVFFDGRGGPPARGGGKTHRFYAAQSDRIANNEIQITIQGQTITSTYGTLDQFIYNAQQMLAAGLSNTLAGEKDSIGEEERALLEELAQSSFEKYDALKKHPDFLSYLEKKSTLKYYGRANIGSRPAKRGQRKELRLSDLRAISFVGSWSQLKQNVPGYFGIGTALSRLDEQGRLDEAKELFRTVPLFRALLLNSMMSLAKTNFSLTSYMAEDEQYGAFWQILFDEYRLTQEYVLKVSGYSELMQEESLSKASVEAREDIVLPLLLIQQYGLMKIQEDGPQKETFEKLVTRSLYGNINASRNSA